MRTLILSLFILATLFLSCGKEEEDNGDPLQPLTFTSLIAEKDTIEPGESTHIEATASGYEISYYWEASAGDIIRLDNGQNVIYTAAPCHIGINDVTCRVKDGYDQSLTKSIVIVVQ